MFSHSLPDRSFCLLELTPHAFIVPRPINKLLSLLYQHISGLFGFQLSSANNRQQQMRDGMCYLFFWQLINYICIIFSLCSAFGSKSVFGYNKTIWQNHGPSRNRLFTKLSQVKVHSWDSMTFSFGISKNAIKPRQVRFLKLAINYIKSCLFLLSGPPVLSPISLFLQTHHYNLLKLAILYVRLTCQTLSHILVTWESVRLLFFSLASGLCLILLMRLRYHISWVFRQEMH